MTPTTMSLLAAAALSIVTIVAEVIKSTKEKKEEESRRIHDMFAEEETYEGNDDELEVIDDEILIDDNGRVFKPVRKRGNLRRDLARRDYSRMYPTYRNNHGASRATRYDVPVRHDYDYAPYNYGYNTRNYARDKYDIEPYDEYLRRQRNSRNYNDTYDFGSIGYNGDYNYDFSHDNNKGYGYIGYKDYYEDDLSDVKYGWNDTPDGRYGVNVYSYKDVQTDRHHNDNYDTYYHGRYSWDMDDYDLYNQYDFSHDNNRYSWEKNNNSRYNNRYSWDMDDYDLYNQYDFSHDNNRNYGYRGYKDYYEDDYSCSNNNKRVWEDVNRKYGMSRYAYGDTCYA